VLPVADYGGGCVRAQKGNVSAMSNLASTYYGDAIAQLCACTAVALVP